MRYSFFQKFLSTILIVVILAFATEGLYGDDCAGETPIGKSITSAHSTISLIAAEKNGLSSPCDQRSDDGGRCDSCRYCVCHAPLISQPVQVEYTPQVVSFTAFEPYKALPEVYLSKFIPPQNLA